MQRRVYYTGLTVGLGNRLKEHAAGRAKFTQSRLPVKLVYSEYVADAKEAARREKQVKDWSRSKKEALIQNARSLLPQLARKKRMEIRL